MRPSAGRLRQRLRRAGNVVEAALMIPMWLGLLALVVMMLNLGIAYTQTTMIARAAVREAALEYDPRSGNLSAASQAARTKCDDEVRRYGFDAARFSCTLRVETVPVSGSRAQRVREVLAVTATHQYRFNLLGFQSPGKGITFTLPFQSTMYAPADYTGGEMR